LSYVIVLHKDEGSDFGVTIPDLEGRFSAGKTIETAIENAPEAIECNLEAMISDGGRIPTPKTIELPDYSDGISAITQVAFDRTRTKIAA
jgi:predicted RNase H-like HicB family nuclease